jgi:hypothetical protein
MTLIDPLYGQKIKIFNFEPEEKLGYHIDVEFDSKSDDDSPEAQKLYLDPLS